MQVRRTASQIEVSAPAKINLFFEVLARRNDGFHEIETLMLPISLCDTLVLEGDPSGQTTLAARWAAGLNKESTASALFARPQDNDLGDLPQGEDNLAVKAVRLLARHAGIRRGAKLQLVKRIPAAAGLGGGSSDAAAALVAANLAWSLGWPLSRLATIAAELGSDVPFFLVNGPAICRGRGEIIEPLPLPIVASLVVVRPPAGLSTASVYQACQPGSPAKHVEPVVEALVRGEYAAMEKIMHNRLLEPARRLSPWVDRVLNRLAETDCPAVGMTGSGTSCFALCRNPRQARRLANRLRGTSIGWVWSVRSEYSLPQQAV